MAGPLPLGLNTGDLALGGCKFAANSFCMSSIRSARSANVVWLADSLDIRLHANAPFGTDTLIALVTSRRHALLELDLKLLDGRRAPADMLAAIEARLEAADRIGIATYSTRR